MAKNKRVTAKEVAKLAGVSPATVSMILNNRDSVKFPEKTCRRVLDACKTLDYKCTYNSSSDRDDKVLIAIVPSFSNLYYVHMIEAMEQRAKELGYSLISFNTFQELKEEGRILQICSQFPFAGILFLYPPENEILLQQVSWKKPIVHVYDKDIHTNVDILEMDSYRIGNIIGEYLIELGHERIAFITSSLNTKQVARIRRLEGLQNAYQIHGFDPDESVLVCTPEIESLPSARTSATGYELGYMLTRKLLECGEAFSAVVAVNDMMAIGAMDAFAESNKRVPQDYSVCGCDNVGISRYKGISLTTVDSYSVQTGREAVDILVKKIERGKSFSLEEDSPVGVIRAEYFPKLIVRKSTGRRSR